MRSAIDLATEIRTRKTSAEEAVSEAFDRIGQANDLLNAFVYLDHAGALARAKEIDAEIASGRSVGRFAGVPFGVKDLDDCAGMPSAYGSRVFTAGAPMQSEPPFIGRLRSAGAVPLGKTATPEFGCSAATWSETFGVTRNPWDPSKTPGGSSGGSAAAVSAGMVPFATATDAGGSTRSPAAFTGLVGLKPSQGLIPSNGNATLNQCTDFQCWGVLTTTVGDTAALLEVAAGPYARDRQSLAHAPESYSDLIESLDVNGLRFGWSPDFAFATVEKEMVNLVRATAERLVDAIGGELVDADLSLGDLRSVSLPRIVEFRALLELEGLYPSRLDELGSQVRDLLEQRGSPTPSQVAEALRQRAELQRRVAALFERVDVLLAPTTACAAFDAELPDAEVIDGAPSKSGAEPLSGLANACWLPALSLPAGLTAAGLPVGLQVIAPFGRDALTLRLGRVLEQVQPWPHLAPAFRVALAE